MTLDEELAELANKRVREALTDAKGNCAEAAGALGVNRARILRNPAWSLFAERLRLTVWGRAKGPPPTASELKYTAVRRSAAEAIAGMRHKKHQ